MKSTKILLAALALGSMGLTSCQDDWAELNQDPAAVTSANPAFLFAEAVYQFDPQPYLEYYYNAPMLYSWSGMGISTGGASESILTLTAHGDKGYQYLKTLKYVREIEYAMEGMEDADKDVAAPYLAAARVLTVYLGLFDTDLNGSLPYTEACRAKFGGPLTPAYDTQETLFNTWLGELDAAIATFTSGKATMSSSQDMVYNGKVEKWAKFANSLKLRIAVRLIHQNLDKAKQIAAAVESASCGYIDSLEDDVMFNKSTVNNQSSDYIYHWFNGFTGCAATESVVNFMIDNLDPRVRFFYTKNSWNSTIVQGYYDAGLEIPEFIEKNVVSEVGADGKKKFVKWGGLGEPWVRYYGLTEDWDAGVGGKEEYKWYFQSGYANAATELTITDAEGQNPSQYTTYSMLNRMMIIGNTYHANSQVSGATLPGVTYTFTSDNRPWYGMYLGAGEINLYLAEFAMLNGNSAKAEEYYNKALEFSVQEYGNLAELNQVAYHSKVQGCFGYDKNEGAIDLKEGEIEAMMAGDDAYTFSGTDAEKLEKIYLQQLLHFTLYPSEQYVTARRSGYPAFNSTILARPQYELVPANKIPRRFPTGTLVDTDKMTPLKQEAYAQQGFTATPSGMYMDVLATERGWADKGAPAWGAGR
jgi:hypothetical protein